MQEVKKIEKSKAWYTYVPSLMRFAFFVVAYVVMCSIIFILLTVGAAVGAEAIMRVEVDALCAAGRVKWGTIGVTKAVATDVKTARNAKAEKRAMVLLALFLRTAFVRCCVVEMMGEVVTHIHAHTHQESLNFIVRKTEFASIVSNKILNLVSSFFQEAFRYLAPSFCGGRDTSYDI